MAWTEQGSEHILVTQPGRDCLHQMECRNDGMIDVLCERVYICTSRLDLFIKNSICLTWILYEVLG